jgi:predicted ATPase
MAQTVLKSFVRRVAIKDFRSIALCDVALTPLVFLVGPNGGGKSNFLDALRFVSDSLTVTMEQALRDRGGIQEVRRRSEGHPNHMLIALEGEFGGNTNFRYGFTIGARPGGGFRIRGEFCQLWGDVSKKAHYFEVVDGEVRKSSFTRPPVVSDERLYLANVSGYPLFQSLHRLLSGMGFYNFHPPSIRDLQAPDSGDRLARDGSNLASVMRSLSRLNPPDGYERILDYLRQIVPGVETVRAKSLGPKETLEFEELTLSTGRRRKFLAANMSDGTLRALGVLAALFQLPNPSELLPPIAVEEPELALHPAAAGVLFDALQEASCSRQIFVTSHSPDLLDRTDLQPESLLAVINEGGQSLIGPVEPGEKQALVQHLRTAGELLRINQLRPDMESIPKSLDLQSRMFDQA